MITPAGYGPMWLGAYAPPAGIDDIAWCIQARVFPASGDTPDGTHIISDAPLAAVLGKYQGDDSQNTRAAIGYLVHQRQEVPGPTAGGDIAAVKQLIANATPAEVKDLAAALIAEGANTAGPYRTGATEISTVTKRTGSVKNVGLLSDAGVWIPGKAFTLTLNGPAVWDTTGTNVLSSLTGSSALEYGWTATGNGTVTGSLKVAGLGRTTLTGIDMRNGRQDNLTYGNRSPVFDPEETESSLPPFDAQLDFQPEITTAVASQFVSKGAPMVDRVTAAAAAGDVWAVLNGTPVSLVASGTLYGPFASQPAQSAAVPAGSPVVGTEALTFNGPGTLSSPGTLSAPASGYYTWVWKIEKAAQAPAVQPFIRGDFTDAFGRVAETSIVPFQPQIATAVGSRIVAPGEAFVDQVQVSPIAGDLWLRHTDGTPIELRATGTLYGPFASQPAQSAAVPAGSPVVGTETLTFNATATKNSPGTLIAATSGYYTWVWKIERAAQTVRAQPYIVGDFVDAFGRVAETSIVPFQPQVTTERNDRVVTSGDGLVDHVTMAPAPGDLWLSTSAGAPVQVTAQGTAYGPFVQPLPAGSPIPAGAPVAGTEALTFSSAGTLSTSGTVKATGPGFYTWVWSVYKSAQPVGFREYIAGDFTDAFMLEIETSTLLHTISHSSQAREYNVVPGGRAFDTITITGMPANHGSFAGLGEWAPDIGTATVRVYGPLVEAPSTVEVPADAPIFYETTIDAKNGIYNIGYDEASQIKPTAGGHYVFVYSFVGDDRVAAFSSPFNDVLERFYVPETPTAELPVQVVTQAQPDAAIDEAFGDTALVIGSVTPGSYLVFEAFGPQDPAAPAVCTSASFTSDRVSVDRPGYYASGKTSSAAPGAFYWVETLYGPDDSVLHRGACGITSETTLVTAQPLEVITKATAEIPLGLAAHDTAIVTGAVTAGTVLSFEAYFQEAESTPICQDPIFTTVFGPISTSGEYESAETIFTAPGTYFWVETLTGADGQILHRGECGAPGETTKVYADTVEVVTKATAEVLLGKPARDTAIVTGYVPDGTSLSFAAYLQTGPLPVCEAPVFQTVFGPIEEPGTYESEETVFTAPGTYFWVETLTGADGQILHRGECGAPGETTKVVSPPPVFPPVTPPAPGTPPDLPVTGSEVALLAAIGGSLILGGASLLTRARRRSIVS